MCKRHMHPAMLPCTQSMTGFFALRADLIEKLLNYNTLERQGQDQD
jgi:hypothetical protein